MVLTSVSFVIIQTLQDSLVSGLLVSNVVVGHFSLQSAKFPQSLSQVALTTGLILMNSLI